MPSICRRRSRRVSFIKKSSPSYKIDGINYSSKPLYDYHKELVEHVKSGLIKSFHLPSKDEVDKSKSKFKAYKATINDITFDSLNESRFYIKLLQDKKAKIVKSFELQKEFELIPPYVKNGKKIRKMSYIADFVVKKSDGQVLVIDVKGIETDVFKLKQKLFEYKYPDLTIICCRYITSLKKWMSLKEYKEYQKQKKLKK